jgi:hypothetical protein
MMYAPSISVDAVIEALAGFLAPFVPGGQIVRAQVNRVPMPADPCCVLTELLQVDLSMPYADYRPAEDAANLSGPTRIDVQIDFYGALAGEYCKAAKAAFRSMWGLDQFPANIKPLYMSDGVQSPLITGEQQWQSRWTATASLQYNPIVQVPQQFADEAKISNLYPSF